MTAARELSVPNLAFKTIAMHIVVLVLLFSLLGVLIGPAQGQDK